MEQLRLEYLAREERFMLDGDRNELRNMKQELDELRWVYVSIRYGSGQSTLGLRCFGVVRLQTARKPTVQPWNNLDCLRHRVNWAPVD